MIYHRIREYYFQWPWHQMIGGLLFDCEFCQSVKERNFTYLSRFFKFSFFFFFIVFSKFLPSSEHGRFCGQRRVSEGVWWWLRLSKCPEECWSHPSYWIQTIEWLDCFLSSYKRKRWEPYWPFSTCNYSCSSEILSCN